MTSCKADQVPGGTLFLLQVRNCMCIQGGRGGGGDKRDLPRGEGSCRREAPASEDEFAWSLMKRAPPETHAAEFLYGGDGGGPGDTEIRGELGPA